MNDINVDIGKPFSKGEKLKKIQQNDLKNANVHRYFYNCTASDILEFRNVIFTNGLTIQTKYIETLPKICLYTQQTNSLTHSSHYMSLKTSASVSNMLQ